MWEPDPVLPGVRQHARESEAGRQPAAGLVGRRRWRADPDHTLSSRAGRRISVLCSVFHEQLPAPQREQEKERKADEERSHGC